MEKSSSLLKLGDFLLRWGHSTIQEAKKQVARNMEYELRFILHHASCVLPHAGGVSPDIRWGHSTIQEAKKQVARNKKHGA
ncbi:MAG: hypothetical protein AB1420_10010 [Bacillota bacterium]